MRGQDGRQQADECLGKCRSLPGGSKGPLDANGQEIKIKPLNSTVIFLQQLLTSRAGRELALMMGKFERKHSCDEGIDNENTD